MMVHRLFIGMLSIVTRGSELMITRFATEESLKEIHRVLRPGAKFGMIWNLEACSAAHPRLPV